LCLRLQIKWMATFLHARHQTWVDPEAQFFPHVHDTRSEGNLATTCGYLIFTVIHFCMNFLTPSTVLLCMKWLFMYFDILLTYLLTPCSRVLLEKLTRSCLVKKFPVFYGTRRFTTPFTSARHLSLSWASSIQSIPPHPNSLTHVISSNRDNEHWMTTQNYFLRFWKNLTLAQKTLSYTSYSPVSAMKIRPIHICQ
jgi:hypothetical protein